MLETQLPDEHQLPVDLVPDLRGNPLGPAPLHAFLGERAQMLGRGAARRHQFLWIFVVQFLQREIAAACNFH